MAKSVRELSALIAKVDAAAELVDARIPVSGRNPMLDELLKKSTLLKDFKAVKEGNVWCLTKSMFQETTCLGDVIMDIHRMLTEDDPEGLTYLYRLE